MEKHEIIRAMISDGIRKAEKTPLQISSFGIFCNASGIWGLKIFWRGKTRKGNMRFTDIELDKSDDTAFMAVKIIKDIIEDATTFDATERYLLRKEEEHEKEKERRGW